MTKNNFRAQISVISESTHVLNLQLLKKERRCQRSFNLSVLHLFETFNTLRAAYLLLRLFD
jgi:phosphoenolpyruvate carboxylase